MVDGMGSMQATSWELGAPILSHRNWRLAEPAWSAGIGSHSMRDTINRDQSCDTESQEKRRRYERRAQPAGGIKPAMASKRDHDVSLEFGGLPAHQPAPNLGNHRQFKQATARRTSQAADRKQFSEQK